MPLTNAERRRRAAREYAQAVDPVTREMLLAYAALSDEEQRELLEIVRSESRVMALFSAVPLKERPH